MLTLSRGGTLEMKTWPRVVHYAENMLLCRGHTWLQNPASSAFHWGWRLWFSSGHPLGFQHWVGTTESPRLMNWAATESSPTCRHPFCTPQPEWHKPNPFQVYIHSTSSVLLNNPITPCWFLYLYHAHFIQYLSCLFSSSTLNVKALNISYSNDCLIHHHYVANVNSETGLTSEEKQDFSSRRDLLKFNNENFECFEIPLRPFLLLCWCSSFKSFA